MRIVFVIQRYGDGVVGGAERYVESMARGLAADGHDIAVVTSCATSYADWADEFPPGVDTRDGVEVHRFPVRSARDNDRFVPLHLRAVDWRQEPLWPWAQDRWSQTMGPDLVGVEPVLQSLAAAADATVLVGYHYSHTQRLTELAAAFGPTIVIPTAHPEGAFHVGAVRRMFEHADEVISLAPEEGDLVAAVHGCGERVHYVPCPVEPLTPPPPEAVAGVASRFGVTVGRYLVVVGRVDPAKGSDDAVDFVGRYRRLVDPSARLVVVGPGAGEGGSPDGVVATGFVDEATKEALVAGAGVVLQPSYMESFSLALVEGWLLDRPALVQGRSRVLAGHVARSGGGLTYTSYDDFEVAAAALLADPVLSARLAAAGHAYARTEFAWDRVAPAFLEVMTLAARSGGRRLGRRGRVST